jgi:excisionase family DNA binding protein
MSAEPILPMRPSSSATVESQRDGRAAGLTVREVARRYRVGEDKVRAWIKRGELHAINTAARLCGKPRWVIPPEALAEFEKGRRGGPAPKPQHRRRRKAEIDFYAD